VLDEIKPVLTARPCRTKFLYPIRVRVYKNDPLVYYQNGTNEVLPRHVYRSICPSVLQKKLADHAGNQIPEMDDRGVPNVVSERR